MFYCVSMTVTGVTDALVFWKLEMERFYVTSNFQTTEIKEKAPAYSFLSILHLQRFYKLA